MSLEVAERNIIEHPFSRLELLVGERRLDALRGASVVVFGVGGVGSWCAEGLARSGIGRLTVVDSDVICVTNINRQLPATSLSIGKSKAGEMERRLREINPEARIEGIRGVYNRETKETFGLDGYDYVVDAIDSLSSKVDLIISATAAGATVFSALGAACKIDPARVKVSSIWKSDTCRLGKFVRKRLRRRGFNGDLLCVWSDEPAFCADGEANDGIDDDIDDNNICAGIRNGINIGTDNVDDNADRPTNKTVNGSLVCVTAVFGFTLAGLVVKDIVSKVDKDVD